MKKNRIYLKYKDILAILVLCDLPILNMRKVREKF